RPCREDALGGSRRVRPGWRNRRRRRRCGLLRDDRREVHDQRAGARREGRPIFGLARGERKEQHVRKHGQRERDEEAATRGLHVRARCRSTTTLPATDTAMPSPVKACQRKPSNTAETPSATTGTITPL